MKILLVRHGETDWNVATRIQGSTDIPLNANGIRQAHELAKKLTEQDYHICAVYASPLSRALETAKIAAEALQLTPKTLDGLCEINFGVWEGICWDDVLANYPEEYKAWHENRRYGRPPQGESYQELLDRFVPALKTILAEQKNAAGNLLVVSHSACIMSLLSLIHETPFQEMVSRYRQENAAIVEIAAEDILRL